MGVRLDLSADPGSAVPLIAAEAAKRIAGDDVQAIASDSAAHLAAALDAQAKADTALIVSVTADFVAGDNYLRGDLLYVAPKTKNIERLGNFLGRDDVQAGDTLQNLAAGSAAQLERQLKIHSDPTVKLAGLIRITADFATAVRAYRAGQRWYIAPNHGTELFMALVSENQDLSQLEAKTVDLEVRDDPVWRAPPLPDASLSAWPIDEEVGGAIFDRDRPVTAAELAAGKWGSNADLGQDDSIVVIRVRAGLDYHNFALLDRDGSYIKLDHRDLVAADANYFYYAADNRSAQYGRVSVWKAEADHHTTFHGRLGEEPLEQVASGAPLFHTIAPVPASSASRDLPRTLHLVFSERRRAGVVTGVALATQGQALALHADTPVKNIAGESGALKFSLTADLVQTIANNLAADADSIQLDLELTFDDASTENHRIPFLVSDPAFPGKFDPNTVDGIAGGDVTQVKNARLAAFSGLSLWSGTKAQFDALAAKDASTVYFYPPA